MFKKIKDLSLGKKIYVSLWTLWVVVLATLVGMLTGLNKSVNETTPPKNGWTVSLNSEIVTKLTTNSDTSFSGKSTTWKDEYEVKDIKATNVELAKAGATAGKTKLDDLKADILTDAAIKNKLTGITATNSLEEIKAAVLKLMVAKVIDKAAIEAMYKHIFNATKYETLAKARKKESFKKDYDLSVTRFNSAGTMVNLTDIVLNDKLFSRSALKAGEWKTTPTDKASKTQNAIAAIGFTFLTASIAAILTTVVVTVKEKKGRK